MAREPIYLTTPLFYVNAEPHLGHTYVTLVADVLARFWRARGRTAFVLTGTDEHGDKIAQAAAAAGVSPREHADRVSGIFRTTWDAAGLRYDHFIRTTDAYHVAFVQKVLADIHTKGDVYFGSYRGLYCFGCERFYQERELVDGLCPDHRVAPTELAEENYFFRMSAYQERLVAILEATPGLIVPEGYRREVLALLREPVGDLCISRPKSRLSWGIELPFDDRYVTYVWFDALLNYVSALVHLGRIELWPAAEHLIGKDILKAHAVFWPTMLMAAGLPLYRRLCVHGHWQMQQGKMSKSIGNVVRPLDMKARYGMDAFRYYLLREMAFGQDAEFSEEALVARSNGDLANGLGNLASRVLAMQQRYFGGVVQPLAPEAADHAMRAAFAAAARELDVHITDLAIHRGLEAVWRALDHANKYVVETAPFTLANDPGRLPRVGAILHELCEALRTAAQLLAPFLPETGERLATLLGLPAARLGELDLPWGAAFAPGHRTLPPEPLFPRVEVPAE
ncbi:MAG: methionine--tRNA ligase [Deltaproteobacteria bacterium]|nr:MAG: methionine--tRNA ligase [Deltaproteobacteria bacterium]